MCECCGGDCKLTEIRPQTPSLPKWWNEDYWIVDISDKD